MVTQNSPRSLQDGSEIVLDPFLLHLDFSLRFWIVFGFFLDAIWAPKWPPTGDTQMPFGGLEGVQDGLGVVLLRSLFRLAVWVGFLDPLGLLLGPCWCAPGPLLGSSWGLLGVFWCAPAAVWVHLLLSMVVLAALHAMR